MRLFKKMLLAIMIIIILLAITTASIINFNPAFGGKVSNERKVEYSKSKQFKNGVFQNVVPEKTNINPVKLMGEWFKKKDGIVPAKSIVPFKLDSLEIVKNQENKLTWFGHSTFLLELDNKKIMIDPIFSERPSPVSFMTQARFSDEIPITAQKLPNIDFVIFSHDHYDHLDYQTILDLKEKVGKFITPLGVGVHLEAWGVDPKNIIELDWWDEIEVDDIFLACTPSRHFSGRGIGDRGATLWSSWVIKGKEDNIYFSGDGGYGPHFKEIGEKYGPFKTTLMECGQYNEMWKDVHMFPEQTVQAHLDVKGEILVPIHWGAFKLAPHKWKDPIERVSKKAKELNVSLSTPNPGEAIFLGESYPSSKWWEKY